MHYFHITENELTKIVVAGSAAVEARAQATVLTHVNTNTSGRGKIKAVSTVFHTQFFPLSCLNTRLPTNPPTRPHTA